MIFCVISVAAAFGAPDDSRPLGGDAEPPPLPHPRLAPLDRGNDESTRLDIVAAQVATLVDEARKSDDMKDRAEGLLAAANRILSSQIEPLCSDRFLQVSRPDPETAMNAAREALDRAESLIAEARTALQSPALAETPSDAPDREPTDAILGQRAGVLEAFASAIRTYLMLEDASEPARQTRAAISRLAPLLEASEPRIAGAAAFWRACLRSLDPDPRAALTGLDLAVANVPPDAPRYGFFCRLLRCRLVAAQRGEPAALALLLQVEERVADWFRNEPERLDAIRTIGLFRMQTLSVWRQRLDPVTQADERAWCAKEIRRIREERFAGGDDETVMRLVESVPMPHPPAAPPEPPKPTLPPPE